jgi:hypothetical protein
LVSILLAVNTTLEVNKKLFLHESSRFGKAAMKTFVTILAINARLVKQSSESRHHLPRFNLESPWQSLPKSGVAFTQVWSPRWMK